MLPTTTEPIQMTKRLVLFALASLFAVQAFATYVVVMKDGNRYRAKAKWQMVNGKAILALENGSVVSLDPALIDEKKSDEVSAMGLGDVNVIATASTVNTGPSLAQKTPLGNVTKLRQPHQEETTATSTPVLPSSAPRLGSPPPGTVFAKSTVPSATEVTAKFGQAYENVGLYGPKVTPAGNNSYKVEIGADNEEKVFNAIRATSFLVVHNGGVAGAQIDSIDLSLKMINGGSAGHFLMTRADADDIDKHASDPEYPKQYFLRKVLF
jgi:hypothetical protein